MERRRGSWIFTYTQDKADKGTCTRRGGKPINTREEHKLVLKARTEQKQINKHTQIHLSLLYLSNHQTILKISLASTIKEVPHGGTPLPPLSISSYLSHKMKKVIEK